MPFLPRSPSLPAVALGLAALCPLPASAVSCGDVLTEHTSLDADLRCGPGEIALIIGASGIRVDLKGHTLSGPFSGVLDGGIGVLVAAPFTGVQLLNGTIQGFGLGVRLDTTSGNTLRSLALLGNVRGIDVASADGNLIERSRIEGSALEAVRLGGASSRNVVRHNALVGNVFGLGAADGASANTFTRNTVTQSGQFGIAVLASGGANVVSRNTVLRTRVDGIVVAAASAGTVVSENTASDNGRDGVSVGAATTGTLVLRNTVRHNDDDGIDVQGAATTLTRNLATSNVDLGIEAVAGATDGGGNVADGNGDPLQCTGVLRAAN